VWPLPSGGFEIVVDARADFTRFLADLEGELRKLTSG
jgi:hypothetical protein